MGIKKNEKIQKSKSLTKNSQKSITTILHYIVSTIFKVMVRKSTKTCFKWPILKKKIPFLAKKLLIFIPQRFLSRRRFPLNIVLYMIIRKNKQKKKKKKVPGVVIIA